MNRKCILGLALLLSAPLTATAADLGPAYRAPAYVAPLYATWTGFYAGLNIGYGFGNSDWAAPSVSLAPDGVLAGATLGYNRQTGLWVWGVEGDIDWSGMKNSTACSGGFSCETSIDWLGTARLRVGYAGWSNWLPYITGGAAFGNVKASNSAYSDASNTRFGWTAGAGIEYAFLGNWSAKLEYLYADLGSFDCATACGGPAVTTDDVSFTTNMVRFGLNSRF